MKKWLIGIAVILSLVCCGLAMAETGGTDGNIIWTLSDSGLLTISGTGTMYDYSSSMCAPWGTTATRVVIEDGVTSIGEYAFANCRINNITIPDSVTSIGKNAFDGCGLHEIHIASISSWLSIEYESFGSHPNGNARDVHLFIRENEITEIMIPEGVMSIGDYAFNGCSSLASITIPDSVTSIGDCAFYGCSSLMNITIPDSVTSIGNSTFCGCSSLMSITIPDSVTSIEGGAFNSCSSLASITIPDSVTSIGDLAFCRCSSLASITIPDSVTSIGGSAFIECSLASITIPDNVTYVGSNAFDYNTIRYAVLGSEGAKALSKTGYSFRIVNNPVDLKYSYTGSEISGLALLACDKNATSVMIPEAVTYVYSGVFANCSAIRYAVLDSEGAKALSKAGYTFRTASSSYWLRYVFTANDVTGMELSACDKDVTSVIIPEAVTSIGADAFRNCSSLTSITIPNNVTNVGNGAFSGCPAIRYAVVGSEGAKALSKAHYTFRTANSSYWLQYIFTANDVTGLELSAWDKDVTSATIPDYVTCIGYSAFENCVNLESITLPSSVVSIGDYAFRNCSSLESITLPDGVVSIGYQAFRDCSNLANITLPDSMVSIGRYAFNQCSNLKNITIPNNLTSIGENAFSYCKSLTNITIPGSVTNFGQSAFSDCSGLTDVTILEGVTSIGSNAFAGCKSLKNITIPDSVITIEFGAFQNCINLGSITIPGSVTNIGNYAFSGCYKLESVTIPENVTSIGDSAFRWCSELKEVYFTVEDEDLAINFGSDIFTSDPTIYCYMFTSPHTWFTRSGYNVMFIENVNVDGIRKITLPEGFRMACGDSRQVIPYVFPDDGEPVIWTSSNPSVLTVSDGLVTALTPGSATVTAAIGTVSATVPIETYIAATGFELSATEIWDLALNDVALSVVSYEPEGASADITWSVSDETLAIVNENGIVTTFKYGDVTVTATSEKGITRTCLLHLFRPVTAISLTAPQSKMIIGDDMQLTAFVTAGQQSCENHLVTFSSSNPAIATVDSMTGLMHAVSPGSVTITATSANNKTGSIEILVECFEHTPVIDEAVTPTCEETGLTEGSHCAVCGEVFTVQEIIPALGHEWGEPAYVWADDNSNITASRVCARDSKHMESETVAVTAQVTKQSTCEEMGQTTYTGATFENEAFSAQTKTLTDVNALGHEIIYTWSDDNSEVTATRICPFNPDHVRTETVETYLFITVSPTKTTKGEYKFISTAFEYAEFEVQEKVNVIPALGTLKALELPLNLKAIEGEAFEGSACQTVRIPDTCTSIGSRAFADCTELIYIFIPASVTDIAPDAFDGCPDIIIEREGE